jgi:hypothetical protein
VQRVVERNRRRQPRFRADVAGAQVVGDAQHERQQPVRLAQPRQALPDREQHLLQQLLAHGGVELVAAHCAPQLRLEGFHLRPEGMHAVVCKVVRALRSAMASNTPVAAGGAFLTSEEIFFPA